MSKDPNQYPPGWDAHRVKDVISYYEGQSDDQAAAEDDAAEAVLDDDHVLMDVPTPLVPKVRELIAQFESEHR